MRTFLVMTAGAWVGLCLMIGCGGDLGPVRVGIEAVQVGRITLGSGWNTWDHWWGVVPGRYRLAWNNAQWDTYLGLLKESGADWIRLDFYYGNIEPSNDNDDPENINWDAFTFDSPQLRSLYRHLDFCQANGIDVYLTYTYLRSNQEYNRDRATGWLSQEAVSQGFRELWTRPKDEPVDKRELAENLAAATYYLIKNRNYTCIKQVCLYVEPDTQWTNVDGFQDTIFLGKLFRKLGIRDQVAILAPHVGTYLPPQPADYDVYAIEDYNARINWAAPQEGLQKLSPIYKALVKQLKSENPSMEVALMEYGNYRNPRAKNPLPSYLSTLSSSCLIFELYNSGFAGAQRWAFEPLYHPYQGWGVIKVEGVAFSDTAPDDSDSDFIARVTTIKTAMERGAKTVKVSHTFEPQRLLNSNLRRGSTIYEVSVEDPTPPGRGICAVAAKSAAGTWRIGLINLYAKIRQVEVVFPSGTGSVDLRWDYYDATLPVKAFEQTAPPLVNHTLSVKLPPRSLNFLREQ